MIFNLILGDTNDSHFMVVLALALALGLERRMFITSDRVCGATGVVVARGRAGQFPRTSPLYSLEVLKDLYVENFLGSAKSSSRMRRRRLARYVMDGCRVLR